MSQFRSRCVNPLNFPKHNCYNNLRSVSAALSNKWSLPKNAVLCTLCRKTLLDTNPTTEVPSQILPELEESPYNGANEESGNDSDECTASQKQLSQLSITETLPVINEALALLNESPIPKKRIRNESFVKTKIDNVCSTLHSELLHAPKEESSDERDLKDIIDRLKTKIQQTENTKDRIQLLTILPQSWSARKISSVMGVSRWIAMKCKGLDILSVPEPKQGRSISQETLELVRAFYIDDEVSVNMPGMKDFVSVRDEDTKRRVHTQKRLVLLNLKELYEKFRLENTAAKIGFSMFASLRPKHCVLAGASGTHSVCVCSIHQNIKLMMIDGKITTMTQDARHHLAHYTDCIEIMTCSQSSPNCHLRTCNDCPGVECLHDYLSEVFEDNDVDSITFKSWISNPRTSLLTFQMETSEFIGDFCAKMEALITHAFITKEQSAFVKHLRQGLKDDEVMVVCDFAENYAFVVQEAAPGFHWNNNHATIFPVVVYFNAESVLCHKSMVIISENLKHDTTAVHVFSKHIIEYVKSIRATTSKIFYVSDGAPQQFKNIKNFMNMYHHKDDFGIDVEWHFFATAHGKGPCDGVGGTVKRMAARASLQLPLSQQITTPLELFEWASKPGKLPKIDVKFSPASEYEDAIIELAHM